MSRQIIDLSESWAIRQEATVSSVSKMASQVRQNFGQESETAINQQIHLEFCAFYTYTSMGYYFDREDVSLQGFREFLLKSADKEYENAKKLMSFQNERGGRIVFQGIEKPSKDEWGSGLEVMRVALALERQLLQSLLDMHKSAGSRGDAQMSDFIAANFIAQKTETVKQMGDRVTLLEKLQTDHGEWHYQKSGLQ